MIRFSLGALRLAKYALPLVGLFPVAFGISLGLEKLAPEKAEAALNEAPAFQSSARAVSATASRVALVIGNSNYPDANAPLRHPGKDAQAMADELRRSGFDVDVQENLGNEEMKRAFERFKARIRPGSVALVSFGGFGIQVGRQSYLIPTDAHIWKEADVRRDGVSIESVLSDMHSQGAGVKLAILDASRRNPFERRFRGLSAGLAAIDAPQGTLFLSAAAPGKVAYDAAGEHSLLIGELLKEINAPGQSAEVAFNRTRIGVSRASNGEQVPLVSSSLVENFAFAPDTPRYADAKPTFAAPVKPTPREEIELTTAPAKPVEALAKISPAPRPADTSPEKTAATSSGSQHEPASRPANARPAEKTAAKEPKAKTVEQSRPRRWLDDVSRDIGREQPRAIIRPGGWYSSSLHGEGSWRLASAYPRAAMRPAMGIGF